MLFSLAIYYLYDFQLPESHNRQLSQPDSLVQTMEQQQPCQRKSFTTHLGYPIFLEQQLRIYNGRAEPSQRCDRVRVKNLGLGAGRSLGWRALRADGAHLLVGGGRG